MSRQSDLAKHRRELALAQRGNKCEKCGATKNLHFHHKDPKTKKFNLNSGTPSWKRWYEELDKCELLCDLCHKIKHMPDHGYTRYQKHGCRCMICRKAYADYHREYYHRKLKNA